MPFGAPRHVVSIKCHTPSRRIPIGASRQVGHFFNAIRHHDGSRLVHPAKWDIGQFWGSFMTDADWCIPSGDLFCISFNSLGFRIQIFNSISTFVSSFQRYTQPMYSFTYSFIYSFICSFIYSFMHLFHIYLK